MAGRFSIESVFKAIDRVSGPVSKMQNRVNKFTRKMQRGFRNLNRSVDKVTTSIKNLTFKAISIATIGMTGLVAVTLSFIKQASLIEDAVAAFTPLLGGVEKAEKLVGKLNKTAASTPFQFKTLADVAKQLLPVMNGDIENTIRTIRLLGDTAGGNAQKLDSIARGFTKAMLKGKVDMESLNMIGEAGVPIFTELAKSMGVEVNAAFFKMISAGKVATTDLTKAFERMTNEGGIFFGGMEIASRTQSGLWSTLKDNIALTAAVIGQQILPISKKYTKEAIKITGEIRKWVEINKELIGQRFQDTIKFITDNFSNFVKIAKGVAVILGILITTSLTLKAIMLTNTLITAGWSVAMFALSAVIGTFNIIMGIAKIVMIGFNIAMAANPIGLIIVAIGALIILGVLLAKNWDMVVAKIVSGAAKIKNVLKFLVSPFTNLISGFSSLFGGIAGLAFGGESDEEKAKKAEGGGGPQMVPPQQRIAKSIEESRETSTAELTIKDETGRADLTQKGNATGINLNLATSGSF